MSFSPSIDELAPQILSGSIRALARAASIIENRTPNARTLITRLFPQTGRAMVIGITGPPGAGKSTLVDQLITSFRQAGKRVGVIAVDPSSPYSKGAILGDRIRMSSHYEDDGVFIRSIATRGHVGGIAHSTLDLALLLDAAGYERVLVETVGVGQDEIEVARLADTTVVVLVPGLGDDIQAMKAGMMEIADIFVINKADLSGAERLEQEIRFAQALAPTSEPPAPIFRITALTGSGVEELRTGIEMMARRQSAAVQTEQWSHRLRSMLRESVLNSIPESEWTRHAELVARRQEDPYTAIHNLRDHLRSRI